MTDHELDELAKTIIDLVEAHNANFVEAIYILDRVKFNFHQSLTELEQGEEDGTGDD